jgi:ABC-type nitrate/sulfonate/bicarbonate transport system substrate-binding protein
MSRRIPISTALGAFATRPTLVPWFALVLAALPIAASAEPKLVLQLHREPQFEFAGYYAALWQGFYRAAGLDVEIKPGTPPGASPIDPVREITEGRAQFGTGTVQLLAAEGQSLLLLAPMFQESGAAVYYRADRDLSLDASLIAGRVGRLPASSILDLELRTALYGEGIDLEKVKSVAMEPGGAIDDLAGRRVEAAVGSAWELPWLARERGVLLRAFNLSGYGAGFYGDSLFTLQRLARVDPLMVQRFHEASIKGWDYALQRPDEIVARILARLPVQVPVSDPVGFARYQTEVARKLARYPDVSLGLSNPERWAKIQQRLINIGVISRPVDLEAFLYKPARVVGQDSDWPVSALLAAAGALALSVTASLLWRRLRWSAAATPAAAGARSAADEALVRTPTSRAAASRKRADRPSRLFDRFHGLFGRRTGRAQLGLSARVARWHTIASDALKRLKIATRRSIVPNRRVAPEPRPTDLNAMLATLERPLRRRLPRSIDCRFSLLPELWPCLADANAVATVVRDLIAAAVADMPGGGDLVVGTRQYAIDDDAVVELASGAAGDYVRLTVKDNGSGLSAECLERIFDPAVTVRPAVAAARELALRLGGFARVESVEGIGTAVHLYFRRASLTAEKSDQQPPEGDEKPQAAAA